jgi:hypothetical protein
LTNKIQFGSDLEERGIYPYGINSNLEQHSLKPSPMWGFFYT